MTKVDMPFKYSRMEVLAELITRYKVEKFAEIGVFKSETTEYILSDKRCFETLKEYWAIDIFEILADVKYDRNNNPLLLSLARPGWALYQKACKLMIKYKQLRVLKLFSQHAAGLFPNNYFDMVFLDADHNFGAVLTDIYAWGLLLKPDGLMTGHDYSSTTRFKGVKKAVDMVYKKVIKLPHMVWIADEPNCRIYTHQKGQQKDTE